MYTALLIELCKLQPGSLPQVLAQATEMLYMRLDTMNTTCIDRFINWFSHHLSNFQFRWSWGDWSDCLTQDLEKPKSKFVREVLEKCMRLSYRQRIIDIVPPSFSVLSPAKPACLYKYGDEGNRSLPGYAVALCLTIAIKNKASNDEIFNILKDVPNPNKDDDDDEGFTFNPLKIEVFVQTLLHLAAKSFSHSFSALAKFHEVFKVLAESDEGKLHVLRVVYEGWKNHPQMIAVLVDKMIRTQIVDCAAVANWIFSSELAHDFTRFYVWEILHSTIRKMNKHVLKIHKELEETKARLARQHKRNSPSLVASPVWFQGRLGVVACPLSSSVNSVWYNSEKDFERLQDVLLNLLLFLKFNLLTYDISLATPSYSYLMLGQLVFNPAMVRPIQGTTESSIP
ncbi:nuclear cap-binding protein subunit 1-like [Opisthocomus hoazin]|uniref:nuclear cap-binding protein subunit 1-like n=1 Tax=Opisthocomus hoazin TaxID=30419 RepID=UPI003F53CFE9